MRRKFGYSAKKRRAKRAQAAAYKRVMRGSRRRGRRKW